MPEVLSIEVDEEFDTRPPAQPFGLKGPDGNWNYGFIGGVAVAVILVIALIVVVVNPFGSDEKPAKVATWNPKNPLDSAQVLPLYSINDQEFQDLQTALDDWANFYTTGDISDLDNSFDLAGKQYALLKNGAPATETTPAVKSAQEVKADVLASTTPLEPAKIELGTVSNAGKKDNLYTLRADITWTQPGGTPAIYKWDVIMKKDPRTETFLINTIATTPDTAINGLGFCDSVTLLYGLDTSEEAKKELGKLTLAEQEKSFEKMLNIRLKVWQAVEPAFIKSEAPDAVPLIIDQYEQSLKLFEKKESLETFFEQYQELSADESIREAHGAAEEAAVAECTDPTDISDR